MSSVAAVTTRLRFSLIGRNNLDEVLRLQADRLIEIGAPREAKVAEDLYRDQIAAAIRAFTWRIDLAAIRLNRVAIVDFRLRGEFLAEAGGVNYSFVKPDCCSNFTGITTPEGALVIRAQWGLKYKGIAARECRVRFSSNLKEQGCTVKEGLTAFLYEGEVLLKECCMVLPGSAYGYVPRGDIPCLDYHYGTPSLFVNWDGGPHPRYGSASRESV